MKTLTKADLEEYRRLSVLHQSGYTWKEIGKKLGINQFTARARYINLSARINHSTM